MNDSFDNSGWGSYGKTENPRAASASVLCFIIRLKRCLPHTVFFGPGKHANPATASKYRLYSPSGGRYNAGVLLLFMAWLKAGTSVDMICFHAANCWSN